MSPANETEHETLDDSGSNSVQSLSENSDTDSAGSLNQTFEKINSHDRTFECSTSLTLIQIVDKFCEDSEAWELETTFGLVKGRTYGMGKPVYFLNGAGASSLFYAPVAWLLREHYKCVIFDSPLYIPDSCKRKDASISSLSNIVKQIAEFHNDQDVTLYASSLGTMVALNCLSQFSDRFSRGLLQGAFSHRKFSVFERLLSFLGRRMPGKLGHIPFYQKILTENHRLWLPLMDQGRWGFFMEHSKEIPVKTLADQVNVIAKTDLRQSLSQIQQPVLLIRTEGDGSVLTECQDDVEKSLSNSKSEMIHSCGLIPYISRPHAIAKLIRTYV